MQILFTVLMSVVMLIVHPLNDEKKTITVTVVNASSSQGKIVYGLYDKEGFLRIPIQGKSSEINNGKSTITFENVPVGEYAITCYHDKNNNVKMDFSPQGMPLEDYGASNNVMTFGPPQYYNSKFTVSDKNVSLEIKL